MPVVEMVELQGNAILVLELGAEQQLWVELELQEVATQLLHVLLDDNLDGLPWEQGQQTQNVAPLEKQQAGSETGLALCFFIAAVLLYLATDACLLGRGDVKMELSVSGSSSMPKGG